MLVDAIRGREKQDRQLCEVGINVLRLLVAQTNKPADWDIWLAAYIRLGGVCMEDSVEGERCVVGFMATIENEAPIRSVEIYWEDGKFGWKMVKNSDKELEIALVLEGTTVQVTQEGANFVVDSDYSTAFENATIRLGKLAEGMVDIRSGLDFGQLLRAIKFKLGHEIYYAPGSRANAAGDLYRVK
jgi:hypothetical protein